MDPRSCASTINDIEPCPYVNDTGCPAFDDVEHPVCTINDIEHPITDDRKYRVIQLENQLEILLIEDIKSDKACVAMSVGVGSYMDEAPYYGLAHFCEHLLFMGSEKYPGEKDYRQYLQDHQGVSNAFTATLETNFFFEIGYQFLEGGLDRFAQFFISPLFLADAAKREIQAINAEFKNNLQSDHKRVQQLLGVITNPAHPYSKFGTGNAYTLGHLPKTAGVDIRCKVMEFYERYYSANLMKLVIIGRESLEVLEDWASSKFAAVQNKHTKAPEFLQSPFIESSFGLIMKAKPVIDTKSLMFFFPVPDPEMAHEVKPASYFTHLIGYQGKGSLLRHLKARELAIDIVTGAYRVSPGHGVFSVGIILSEKGLKKYEEVILAVFQYLKLITATIHERIANEIICINEENFKYKDKIESGRVTGLLASAMQKSDLPRNLLLNSGFMKRFERKLVRETADCFEPYNFSCILAAKDLKGLDQKEEIYGTQFNKARFTSEFLDILKNVTTPSNMHLPGPNAFIATNFDVVKLNTTHPAMCPSLVYRDDKLAVWHKKDDQFWTPKGKIVLEIRKPILTTSPLHKAMMILLVRVLNEHLAEFTYDATVAGLQYACESSDRGLKISVEGFNDKLDVLLEVIVSRIKNLEIDRDKFQMMKQAAIDHIKSLRSSPPFLLAANCVKMLLVENKWHFKTILREMESVTVDDVQVFLNEILTSCMVEILAVGNITDTNIIEIAKRLEALIDHKPLLDGGEGRSRCYLLPENSIYNYVTINDDAENPNSCVYYYLQVAHLSDVRNCVLVDVLHDMLSGAIFDRLRSKEQLGYIVYSEIRDIAAMRGYAIVVQSERDTEYLERRIENLLMHLRTVVAEFTDEQLAQAVQTVRARYEARNKNISDEFQQYWTEIGTSRYDFSRRKRCVNALNGVTKKDLSDLYDRVISPSSQQRSLLTIHQKSRLVPKQNRDKLLAWTIFETSLDWGCPFTTADARDIAHECTGKPVGSSLEIIEKKLKEKGYTAATANAFKETVADEYKLSVEEKTHPQGTKIENIPNFQADLSLDEADVSCVGLSSYLKKSYEKRQVSFDWHREKVR